MTLAPAEHDAGVAATRCVIIGAGPAGLTAAYELGKSGVSSVVLEMDQLVGGISRTVEYKGYRFDIGGHRFFTKVKRVHDWWMDILGDEFLVRPRLSRIYYRRKYFDYPLKPFNTLRGLGPLEAIRCVLSYLCARAFPSRVEDNVEQWVSNRFGHRLYSIFFETYTEKVWGMPCAEISADWAAQRIKNLDLLTAIRNAFAGSTVKDGRPVTTLMEQFRYPRLGPGMMWERVTELLREDGHRVDLGAEVTRVHHDGRRVTSLVVQDVEGNEREEIGTHFVSSMPISNLLNAMDPAPPAEVLKAANRLRYRDFLTVGLVVAEEEPFPDTWLYIHSPEVKVGRIQNFHAWSPEMAPVPGTGCIGLEYFVQENDELWSADDDELIALGKWELAELGLLDEDKTLDAVVIRMAKAYPVYDGQYQDALRVIRGWLDGLDNLQLVGRNGQHRYNNQDHSMMTAMLAAENILGAEHDIWGVNVEEDYLEEVTRGRPEVAAIATQRRGDPLVPSRLETDPMVEILRGAFARYDGVALGSAVGTLMGFGLFFATVALLLSGGEGVEPALGLLGQYFLGFEVSWNGALLGLLEVGAFGFGYGLLLAKAINATVALHERALIRRLEVLAVLDGVDEGVG